MNEEHQCYIGCPCILRYRHCSNQESDVFFHQERAISPRKQDNMKKEEEEQEQQEEDSDQKRLEYQVLQADEVLYLHSELRKLKEEYKSYVKMIENEEKLLRMTLRKMNIAKKCQVEIEKKSWKIAMKLGLTDFDSYLGL